MRFGSATLVLIPLLMLAACVPGKYPPVALWYVPSVKPLSGGEPVAVYMLRDLRYRYLHGYYGSESETYVGFVIHKAFEGKGLPLYANEPVAVVATRALSEGLKARGVPVVDRTRRMFRVGDEAEGARVAILGEIQRLGFPEGGDARCALHLELREIESGKMLWEKSFSSQVPLKTDVRTNPHEAAAAVSTALSLAVDDAVMDPELTSLLTRH
jgi:hypothetical protein